MYKFVLYAGIIWGGLSLLLPLQAQSLDTARLFKQADNYFSYREYQNAIPLYDNILKTDKNNVKANFRLGLCYLNSITKEKASEYLNYAYALNPRFDPIFEYYLGEGLKYVNKVGEAIPRYESIRRKYLNINEDVKIINDYIGSKDFILLLDQRIKECRFGIKYFTDPTNARVRNIGKIINSEFADYAPVISADESELIFTSRRRGNVGNTISREDNKFYEDIYITEKKKGKWTAAKNISKSINTKSHEASIGLSPDGNTLYIYKDDGNGDIYYSEKNKKGEWSEPKKMGGGINGSSSHETSFTITKDGKTAYFASDRKGGFGGLDIYRVTRDEKGNWGNIENLGPTINTVDDEDAPFIHFDSKTLYFSSRGHETMGGFDVFYTELNNDQWSKPINLGSPINTTDDDIYFVLSADYKRGYFASTKKGGQGDKDIYVVDMPDYRDVEMISFQLSIKTISIIFNPLITNDPRRAIIVLRGSVKDEDTDDLLSARMVLYDVEENQPVEEINSVKPEGIYYTTMFTGKKYLIYVQKEGYLYHSEYFEIPLGVINQEKVLNIYLRRIRVGGPGFDFKALYEYNSAKLDKTSIPALERLLNFLESNPRIKGALEGHTDNIGSEQRNKILSAERAKSVYDWLISRGIDENRLSYEGFWFSKPLQDNNTAHGRSLNRRVEFRIVEIGN